VIETYDGLVAFNSWGEAGFWAHATETIRPEVTSVSLGPDVIAAQIPAGGAYIALMVIDGPPSPTTEKYRSDDLSGLNIERDWRMGESPWVYYLDFYKANTYLTLVIACKQDASDATVDRLNALLKSWRFVDFEVD
jgi:hypothetical protein